jgi:fatty acid desaturase
MGSLGVDEPGLVSPQILQTDEHLGSLVSVTSEELSRHNKVGDLWVSIQGKVYDVTGWLKDHPGGDLPLLHLAGQDVTDAFLAFHPGTAWRLLPQFLVGTLSDYDVSPMAKEHRRLLQEFKKAGLYKNPLDVYALYACWVVPLLVLSVLGVLYSRSFTVHMLSAAMLGVVWNQSGWVGHDTGHCGMTKNRDVDRWFAILVGDCLSGISMGWWKRNHNAHHIACNSIEYDPDLQYIPLFAVTSKLFGSLYSYFYDRVMPFDGVARSLIAYQHWTFYPIMAVARVNLFVQSILVLTSRKHVPDRCHWFLLPVVLHALILSAYCTRAACVCACQFCSDRDPACAVLFEPLFIAGLPRAAEEQGLGGVPSAGHSQPRYTCLHGLVSWGPAVPDRAPPVPYAATPQPQEGGEVRETLL